MSFQSGLVSAEFPELLGIILRHGGTVAVLNGGFREPIVEGCYGNLYVFGGSPEKSFVYQCNRLRLTAEVCGRRLGAMNIRAARTRSLPVRNKQIPRATILTNEF